MSRRSLIAAFAACMLVAAPAFATPDDDDKIAAQQQFSAGQKAFAAGDFRAAALAFEEAYRRKPHHAPLWNAARAWNRAGENVRAANLYAKYLREAPPGTKDRDVATQALNELGSKLAKVSVVAGPTDAKIDDAPNDPDGAYVAPGEHVVTGVVGGTAVRKSITVLAGQTLSVTLEAPAPLSPVAPTPIVVIAPPRPKGFHLPWVVVAIGGALAATAGGFTIWSGLDASSKRDQFDANVKGNRATQTELTDGRATQTRTNVLIGVTGGLVVLTAVAALFVEWRGNSN